MKTKTEEVQELVVLTPEQIEALPKEVKKNVVFLTETVGAKDLMVLNPMVTELLEIREQGKAIKLIPADKEGNYDKDNIQSFTDVKKRVRTFRAEVGRVAKQMKEDPAKITKAIIAIEKTFVAEATDVYDAAEKEFADYIKDEIAKAEAKQAEKDKALTDMIEASNKIGQDATLQLERTNLYNKIKYEKVNRHLVELVQDAIINGSKRRLEEVLDQTNKNTFELETADEDVSILATNVLAELKEWFAVTKRNAIIMLGDKLKAIAIEEEKARLEVKAETPVVQLQPENKENTPASFFASDEEVQNAMYKDTIDRINAMNDIEFSDHILTTIANIYSIVVERLKEKPSSSPVLYDVRNILSQILKLQK